VDADKDEVDQFFEGAATIGAKRENPRELVLKLAAFASE
jgi:hypothetical protein